MKPRSFLLASVSTLGALLSNATPAHSALLFLDDFDTSAQSLDVNFELFDGRQTGILAPIAYVDTDPGGGYRTQVNESTFPDALFFFPDGADGHPDQDYASPNFNFNSSGGLLEISMLALTQGLSMEGADYIGFNIGGDAVLDLPYAGTGFGLVLRPHFSNPLDNNFEIYGGGTLLLAGHSNAVALNSNLLSVTLDAGTFDGSFTSVNLSINGVSIFADTLATGFTNNYITVGAGGFSSDDEFYGFDNLSVSTVPEPTALLSLLGASGVLLALRRRG